MKEADAGRMVALMGDAELDEGNIYECPIEAYKHDIRNCWWVTIWGGQSQDRRSLHLGELRPAGGELPLD